MLIFEWFCKRRMLRRFVQMQFQAKNQLVISGRYCRWKCFNDWSTYYFHTLLKTIKKAILLEITMNPPNAIHFSVNLISKTIFPWQTVKFVFQYCQLNVTKWCSQRVVSNCLWKSTTVQPSNKKWWVLPYKSYIFSVNFLFSVFVRNQKIDRLI